jgi:hypothetical protein
MRVKVLLAIVMSVPMAVGVSRGGESAVVSTQAAAGADSNGGHYLAFWQRFFQGEWTVRVLGGDETGRVSAGTVGTLSCQLAPTQVAMLYSATTHGRPDSNGIGGFDPRLRVWKEVSFMADGGHLTQSYHASPSDLEGDPTGKVIKGKAEYIQADGRVGTGDVSLTIVDPDSVDYLVTNRRTGEQVVPDLQIHFRRKK